MCNDSEKYSMGGKNMNEIVRQITNFHSFIFLKIPEKFHHVYNLNVIRVLQNIYINYLIATDELPY